MYISRDKYAHNYTHLREPTNKFDYALRWDTAASSAQSAAPWRSARRTRHLRNDVGS